MARTHALISAAGAGVRMGADRSKVLIPVHGKALLRYAVEAFDSSPSTDAIHIVVAASIADQVRQELSLQRWRKPIEVSAGGRRRQDSVYRGLQRIGPCDFVIVHDAARPLVTEELIGRTLSAAMQTGAATAAVPMTDTCKQVSAEGFVQTTLPRPSLRAVQTPQAFRYDWLIDAHAQAAAQQVLVDDDAELVERLGHPVQVVLGDPRNIKITTPLDLLVMEAFLNADPSPLGGRLSPSPLEGEGRGGGESPSPPEGEGQGVGGQALRE